jgi:hypothetical protein
MAFDISKLDSPASLKIPEENEKGSSRPLQQDGNSVARNSHDRNTK